MVGIGIRHLYDLRDDTYRTFMAEFSQARSREKAGGARVRLRTSAAHRSGLAITFRQRLRRTAAAVRNRIRGRVLDGGITDVPGRSSDAGPRALDLGGQTQALPQSGGKSGDAIAHSICYRLSLRMIPSNTARRV